VADAILAQISIFMLDFHFDKNIPEFTYMPLLSTIFPLTG